MEIKQQFINLNHGGQLRPIGIVLHETANLGGTAQMHYKYFNDADRQASAHAFVDWQDIIQLVPWNEVAWHAGPITNHSRIGIELCHPATHDPAKFIEIWNRGVWLFAWLFVNVLKRNNVTPDNLMSHAEVSARWHETDHTDPVQYFNEYNTSVDAFRSAVQTEINKMIGGNDMFTDMDKVSPWAKDAVKFVEEKGIMVGGTDGAFNPQGTVTREQLAVVITNLINKKG